MPFRQLFFIEGKLLGETQRAKVFVHSDLTEPTSDLYFCGLCGDVYARLPCLRADGSSTPWQSYRCLCRKCGESKQRFISEWPGSIWRSWDREFLEALPPEVLAWELLRHLDSWQRFPEGYQ
jgi:hypothetical protein